MRKLLYLGMVLMLFGCGAQRPLIYPDDHARKMGTVQADRDVAECERLADAYVKSHPGEDVVRDTAIGGGVGAAIGAVGGAVAGGAGRGAAIGAATGATGGLLHGLFRASEPSPLYKRFVEQCLRERGYQVLGWD